MSEVHEEISGYSLSLSHLRAMGDSEERENSAGKVLYKNACNPPPQPECHQASGARSSDGCNRAVCFILTFASSHFVPVPHRRTVMMLISREVHGKL